jgi:O-antigen/teichoic acid export membrane protein
LCSQLTGQLSASLFPVIVDSDAADRQDRLRAILLHSTSLSLALGVPICTGMWLLAGAVVERWMGPHFEGSVVILRFMLAGVLLGVATSSSSAILKGAGQHRLLAGTNATTAIVNLLLSIVLIKPLGLTGVILGTLIPVTTAAVFVVIPSACARVGMSVWTMWSQAIWPALWPAAGLAAVIWVGRPFAGPTLAGLGALLVVAGLVYEALFMAVAISPRQRGVYLSKLGQLAGRGWRVPAAA